MEYQVNEYTAENRCRSQNSDSNTEVTGGMLSRVLRTQIIVFALLILIIVILSKTQSNFFSFIKEWYQGSVAQYDMTYEEIGDGISEVIGFLTQPKTAVTDETAETASQTETELTGAGGEDLLYPRENASFSPIYLSEPPVRPVKSEKYTSHFGYRINPVTNEYGFHSGLDIASPEGTPIRAAFDGTVEKAGYSAGRGNHVFLKSEGGIVTVYCHCSELLVNEGDSISAGQVLARVGSTGQATGPHLHFEIRINGVYYNPLWVLDS